MRRSKVLASFLFFIFIFISCKEHTNDSEVLGLKNELGEFQIYIDNTRQKELAFGSVADAHLGETSLEHPFHIAQKGYLNQKRNIPNVVVLGEKAETGSLVSALPIGVVRFIDHDDVSDWHIFADKESEICNLEDLVVNHHLLKNRLQSQLKVIQEADSIPFIWYDEDFLELKLNQVQ